MKTNASSPNSEASKRSAIAIAFITIYYYNNSLRNKTTCMHRNRKLCISFFMANMANGTPPQRYPNIRRHTPLHEKKLFDFNRLKKECSFMSH